MAPFRHRDTLRPRGSILIVALWILAILVLLSLGLGYAMSLDERLLSYQRDRLRALWLAKAGYRRAVAELERPPSAPASGGPPQEGAPPDPWFAEVVSPGIPLGEGRYTVSARMRGADGEERPVYGVLDEDRKINLNTAPRDVLKRLPLVTDEMADSILDWLDQNPTSYPLGAEDFYYRSLDLPYRAKNAPFELLEEVLLVKGVTEDAFRAIRPFITIYTDGRVNVNTAPREVLIALGMSEGLVGKILRFRARSEIPGLTTTDRPFKNLGSAQQELNAAVSTTPQEGAEFTNLVARGLLKVDSQVFRVTAQGVMRSGKVIRSVEAIVKRKVKKAPLPSVSAALLDWQEL